MNLPTRTYGLSSHHGECKIVEVHPATAAAGYYLRKDVEEAFSKGAAQLNELRTMVQSNFTERNKFLEELDAIKKEWAALKQSSEFHSKGAITLLDAKWLDPACHKGCQSLKYRGDLEVLMKERDVLKAQVDLEQTVLLALRQSNRDLTAERDAAMAQRNEWAQTAMKAAAERDALLDELATVNAERAEARGLRREMIKAQDELARVSEELGLPSTVGPAPGWLRSVVADNAKFLAERDAAIARKHEESAKANKAELALLEMKDMIEKYGAKKPEEGTIANSIHEFKHTSDSVKKLIGRLFDYIRTYTRDGAPPFQT